MDEVFQLGSIAMAIRSLDARAARGVARPFVALVPALDLARLPATLQAVMPLIAAGCADVIVAGPRADAFQQQIAAAIANQGASAGSSSLVELGDACYAALLGAVVHKAAVALCADEPEMLGTLRGVAEANGWTVEAKQAKPAAKPNPRAAKPKQKPKQKSKPKRRR